MLFGYERKYYSLDGIFSRIQRYCIFGSEFIHRIALFEKSSVKGCKNCFAFRMVKCFKIMVLLSNLKDDISYWDKFQKIVSKIFCKFLLSFLIEWAKFLKLRIIRNYKSLYCMSTWNTIKLNMNRGWPCREMVDKTKFLLLFNQILMRRQTFKIEMTRVHI